ncbi:nitrile hydratase regulator [Tistrella bauzanensis]|uniref:Nitrile hydratase regulator n=1 Tax=Tistrella bauzanensis TaxID=657419 RepID=A0ABQ1JDH1_9PROT|nr:substrate-binding domain-containing protein [Tistrella bauzanensis]GGB63744.1 nitrile hydratase regulator [Tistrella bauzanensis]
MTKIKIGLLISQSGPTGVWAPSCINSAILGAAEANAAGGIRGAEIDLVVRDAGWEPASAARLARDLIDVDGVSAIVAMVASNARRAISFAVAGRVPFIYTPNYERDEPEPTIAVSSTDDHLIPPMLAWIEQRFHARRFFLIGSDYRWPRRSMPMAGRMISTTGGHVVGMLARPLNAANIWDQRAIEDIRKTKPDVVLCFLVGDQGIPFYRAYGDAGLAALIPRCAIATDETVLTSLTPAAMEGLYAGACYFAASRTRPNTAFMERYWSSFGSYAPIPNFYGQSCYEGISFSLGLLQMGNTTDPQRLLHLPMNQVAYRSARFDTSMSNLARRLPVYIAEADGMSFAIIARF